MTGIANERIEIPLSNFPLWDPWTDIVGMRFAGTSDVVLQQVQLHGYSGPERLMTMVKSFFTLNEQFAYSINFIWGPILVDTPAGISHLYEGSPPMGWSVNRIFYGILLFTIAILLGWVVWSRMSHGTDVKRRAFIIFCTVFAGLWILYDLRMNVEVSNYFVQDFQRFILPELGKKELRSYKNFHDALEQSLPTLLTRTGYSVLAPEPSPFRKMAATRTYPDSNPLFTDEDQKNASAYFVFYRPDVQVLANGSLAQLKGEIVEILSASGTVKKFSNESYLYIPMRK